LSNGVGVLDEGGRNEKDFDGSWVRGRELVELGCVIGGMSSSSSPTVDATHFRKLWHVVGCRMIDDERLQKPRYSRLLTLMAMALLL
jgi:hypothetical protein